MVNFFSYFLTCSNTSTINDVVGNYITTDDESLQSHQRGLNHITFYQET